MFRVGAAAAFLFLAVVATAQQDPALERAAAILDKDGADAAIGHLKSCADPEARVATWLDLVRYAYRERKDLDAVVALSRAAILHVGERTRAAMPFACDLASFTWPGWNREGIDVRPPHREAGIRAARLYLDLARELSFDPETRARAWWLNGAWLLVERETRPALEAFEHAAGLAREAGEEPARLYAEGYAGLALLVDGTRRKEGAKRFTDAVAALRKDGTTDATYFADQLEAVMEFLIRRGLSRPQVPATRRRIDAGPLVLDVTVGDTAHVFHVVDQLSRWSPYCHRQYLALFPRDGADEAALAAYAAIRKAKGWGGGLEQTFYNAAPIDEALFAAARDGVLGRAELMALRDTLLRFEKRVGAYYGLRRKDLEAFAGRVDRERLAREAKRVARFTGVEKIEIPTFLVASPPGGSGGGYNGGRLVLEIPPDEDVTWVLLHEVFHAFLRERKEAIEAAAKTMPGLDVEALDEGMAYAFAPGIVNDGGDPLRRQADPYLAGTKDRRPSAARGYDRFRLLGLAFREALAKALEQGSLADFLPRAREIWLADQAIEPSADGARTFFTAGPLYEKARARVSGRLGIGLATNHLADHYRLILDRAKPGDVLALLVAGDHADQRFPPGFDDLFPVPPAEVLRRIGDGETVAADGAARGLRVVLLAAPTTDALSKLIASTPLLGKE